MIVARVDRLYEEAMKLAPEERRALLRRLQRSESHAPGEEGLRTIPWDDLRRARGVVTLGGDALVDLERLYDHG